jgi:arsenate reductase-like glutaredoxin family protein
MTLMLAKPNVINRPVLQRNGKILATDYENPDL